MLEGNYTPAKGEYCYPQGKYILEVPKEGSHDRHFVRAAFVHQNALSQTTNSSNVLFELVPEPGNPYDHWAVAFHLNGRRVGYMAGDTAPFFHEYIAGHNVLGRAVYAYGDIDRTDPTDIRALVRLPWWRDRSKFCRDSGLPDACRKLIEKLPAEVQLRAMKNSQNLDPLDAAQLRSFKNEVPSLVWPKNDECSISEVLRLELIALDKERKASEWEARTARRLALEREKKAAQKARSDARGKLEADIRELTNKGLSKAAIARELGCSVTKVRSTLKVAGIVTEDANDLKKRERHERAVHALKMQRRGMLRREIAQSLNCSVATVKVLLKDARFFENPDSDPDRFRLAREVSAAEGIKSLSKAAELLGWDASIVKSARGDAKILGWIS